MTRKSWNKFGRLHGHHAGRRAIVVYRCKFCGLHHEGEKPFHCKSCDNIDFMRFDSKGEAGRYASLALQEKAGLLYDLRAQVRFPLLTFGIDKVPRKFADYVADFVYMKDGKQHIEDFKPSAGMDPVAALKLRCMEAMGFPVKIVTEKDN